MYYVYVLQGLKDHRFYTGYTEDLKRRFDQHNYGKNISTRFSRPLKVVYYEACLSEDDALHRERYLKSTYDMRFINSRLKNYLAISHA